MSETSAARRTRSTSPQIRERLLTAGLDLFHSRGYHATGVQEITGQAGVPKGSFYNHFASKQELAVAALERYAMESPVDLLMDEETMPVEALRAHFEELGRRFVDSGYRRGCLMGNFANELADHDQAVRATLTGLFSAWTQLIATVLARGQEAGEVTTRLSADQLAGSVLSIWEGSLTRTRALGDDAPLTEFFDTVFSHLLPA